MRRTICFLALSVLTFAPWTFSQQFTRDNGALQTGGPWTDGVELADVDGDGDLDLLFANGSSYGGSGTQGAQAQRLYLNDGNGQFTPMNSQLNVSNFNAKMVIAEDFDGDGDLDLAYASGSAGFTPKMLINNGSGVFSDESAARLPALSLRSFSVVAGDVDDDGDLDLALSDGGTFGGQQSQARLLTNNGAGFFTDVTSSQMPSDLFNCQDITFFDFDGDFDVDMALSGKGSSGKRGRLYLNDGNGNFSVDSAMNGLGTGSTYEIEWGDLDGDSDFDAAVQSISGTSEGIGRNVGPGAAMPESTLPSPNGQDDNEMAMIDYDNDGDLDILIGSLGSLGERLYRNNGGGSYTSVNSSIQTITDSTLDLAIGDINGDCRYDFVTGQGESGNYTNKVYVNSGPVDTIAPTFLNVEDPPVTGPVMTAHVHIQDAVSEDGHTNATVSYTYSTDSGGSGGGSASHMGGGLFRATMNTTAATSSVSITWIASDGCGNSSVEIVGGGGGPWIDLGFALPGVNGDPFLMGSGTGAVGTNNTLTLSNAAPSAPAMVFVGLGPAGTGVSFKGGTLIAFPFVMNLPFFTNAAGAIPIPFSMPGGVSGLSLVFQYGISDGAAVSNVGLSNGLQLDIP